MDYAVDIKLKYIKNIKVLFSLHILQADVTVKLDIVK